MREYSWLERPVSWSHFRIFEAVLDRLDLSTAWQSQLHQGTAPLSDRVMGRISKDAADWISKFSVGASETIFSEWSRSEIGGRTPEEALLEFGRAVRVVEIEAARVVSRSNGVEAISKRQGGKSRSKYWGSESIHKTEGAPFSLDSCALALHQSALGWLDWPSQGLPLAERDIPGRYDWVLLECPHRDPLIQEPAIADFLCSQHIAWFQGLSHAIDSRLSVIERSREADRRYCRLSLVWGTAS